KEELSYDVDVSRVAGLRLVSNTLEFLDDGGTPRLRVAPPWVVDARSERNEARITLEGCAHDASTIAPWGRKVTPPGNARCVVRVAWEGAEYPAIVDPSWTATGSLAVARDYHTATRLASGQVLVAGGLNGALLASAEIFDGISSFTATGSLVTG